MTKTDPTKITDLSYDEAKKHFFKGNSYFDNELPKYIDFEPMLNDILEIINKNKNPDSWTYKSCKKEDPSKYPKVNYTLISNKDGRFSWRPLEIIHPVIYASLVNLICSPKNWNKIKERFRDFEKNTVKCCSIPVISQSDNKDKAEQISTWWQKIEQNSLCHSLKYGKVLHTDVEDCYGSLYTHSITWALNSKTEGKSLNGALLGDEIDCHIRAGRYGQTNGISQGSVLMDFIAEIVLGYVDEQISENIRKNSNIDENSFAILRYRDDYRIFVNNVENAENILKEISASLREVGMRLSTPKTVFYDNTIEGSIKPDKLAAMHLQDLGTENAKTLQKQLLRLHSFSRKFPNSGALKRLLSDLHKSIEKTKQYNSNQDLEVCIAILVDIAVISPATIPAIAAILSHLIAEGGKDRKKYYWEKIHSKMKTVPNNGFLEIWLQRIMLPSVPEQQFESNECLCQIANKCKTSIWCSAWLNDEKLKKAIDTKKILVQNPLDMPEKITHEEIELFTSKAYSY